MGMTPGDALLKSMALIPEQGQAPLDLQAVLQSAARRLTRPEPIPTMITLLGAGAAAWYAPPPTTLVFPRDHGLHLACGPEWYWIACTLDVPGSDGETVGVLISMQRNRVVDPSVQADAGWTDEQAQLVFSYATVIHTTPAGSRTYARRPNMAWPPLGGETTMQADPFRFGCGPDILEGSENVLPLRVRINDREGDVMGLVIDLTLDTDMPVESAFFLQGDNGVTPPPRAGIYYSWPQLRVHGHVALHGVVREVEGRGWMDHELMYTPLPPPPPTPTPPPDHWTPAPGIAGWTFCDFNFDNGDALVVAGFQDGPMQPDLPAPYGFYLRRKDGAWEKTFVTGQIVMDAFMPLTGQAMLPVSWTCVLMPFPAGDKLTVSATPWFYDGSFLAINQSVQGETPVSVTLADSRGQGAAIGGAGYCESVGYEPPTTFMARAIGFLEH